MKKFYLVLVGALAIVGLAIVGPAGATSRSSGATGTAAPAVGASVPTSLPAGEALYNGKVINLSQSWDGAQSCLFPASGPPQCYATLAAAKTAANAISAQEVATAQAAAASAQVRGGNVKSRAKAAKANLRGARDDGPCDGDSTQWLWLYQNSNYGGGSVGMQSTDDWFNLGPFGFADQTSSYINETACDVFMIQTYDGSGPWLVVNPWTYTSYIGNAWNDKVTEVYIAQN